MKTVLLVVDVQQALVDNSPAHKDEFLINLKFLIDAAHASGTEVVYVRHDSSPDPELAAGTPGWQICSALKPRVDERIVDKHFSSSFRRTNLREYLDGRGVERIVLCGMQTEYCIDTTCKVAFEYGYDVIVPSGCTSTFANPLLSGEKIVLFYEKLIWHPPLATVVPMEDALALLSEK